MLTMLMLWRGVGSLRKDYGKGVFLASSINGRKIFEIFINALTHSQEEAHLFQKVFLMFISGCAQWLGMGPELALETRTLSRGSFMPILHAFVPA